MSSENGDDTDMIELKDPDLDYKKDISVHHIGICIMQRDRSASGLTLNTVYY